MINHYQFSHEQFSQLVLGLSVSKIFVLIFFSKMNTYYIREVLIGQNIHVQTVTLHTFHFVL